jgi:hypothetical protein
MRADRCPDEKIILALRQAAVGFALVGALTGLSRIDAQSAVSLDCPLEGDAKSTMVRTLNRLKNRTAAPVLSDLDTAVTMKVLTAPGDDRNRFSMRRAAMLQGYVVDVKVGGIESTNCHAKDPIDRDTHIELTLTPNNPDEASHVIVEVTPRWRALMRQRGSDWSTPALRRGLLGRWIEVTGWLLYDREHEANAVNTHRGAGKVWRATVWEVHPISALRVLPAPPAKPPT